jgi:hypothetical protein
MTRFWAICQNAFVQTIRQPIFAVLIMVTVVVLVMGVPLSVWAMGDYQETNQRLLEATGLATLLLSGLLLAAFSASAALGREIEDRTAVTVMSKPVARSTFVLGKFAGVAGAVTLGFYLCSLVYMMTVRHGVMPAAWNPYDWPVIVLGLVALGITIGVAMGGNYLFGWSFIASAVWTALAVLTVVAVVLTFVGKEWALVPPGYEDPHTQVIGAQLLISLALSFLAVLLLTAVAVAGSTRLGQVMTLMVCLGLLVVGSLHSVLMSRWSDNVVLARASEWLVPKLTLLIGLEAGARGREIPVGYLAQASLYTLVMTTGILSLGVVLFQRRQMDSEGASSVMPGLVYVLAGVGRIAAVVAGAVGLEALLAAGVRLLQQWLGHSWLLPVSLRPITPAWLMSMLAVGGGGWLLWGWFGRGVRWTWWLVSLVVAAALAGGVAMLVAPQWRPQWLALGGFGLVFTTAALAAITLILMLPKTREHFRPQARGGLGAKAAVRHSSPQLASVTENA